MKEKDTNKRENLHKHIDELIKKAGNTTNNTANITLNCCWTRRFISYY